MKVQNRYGTGHKERIYQKALEEEFLIKSIAFESEPKIPVISLQTGKQLGWYQPDFLVDDKIIVELKSTEFPIKRFEEQVEQYLRTSQYKIAYLINFGIKPLHFRRFIFSPDPTKYKTDPI